MASKSKAKVWRKKVRSDALPNEAISAKPTAAASTKPVPVSTKKKQTHKSKAAIHKQSAAKKKPIYKIARKQQSIAETTKKSAIIGSGQLIVKTATSAVKNRCEICKLECSSQMNLEQHCRGKKHRKAMASKTESGTKKSKPVIRKEAAATKKKRRDTKVTTKSPTRTKVSETQKGKAAVQKQEAAKKEACAKQQPLVDYQIECNCGATMKKTTTGGRHSNMACVECGSRVPVYYRCPAGKHPHCVCVLCAAIIERFQRITKTANVAKKKLKQKAAKQPQSKMKTTKKRKQWCALGESLVDGDSEFKYRKTASDSLTHTDLSTGVGSDFRKLLSDDFLWPDFWWKDAGKPTFFESSMGRNKTKYN